MPEPCIWLCLLLSFYYNVWPARIFKIFSHGSGISTDKGYFSVSGFDRSALLLKVWMHTDLSVWTQGQKISTCMLCLWHRCSHKLLKLHSDHKTASAADVSRNAGRVLGYQTIMIIFAQPGKMSTKLLFLFGAFYTHFTLLCASVQFPGKLERCLMIQRCGAKTNWG